MDENVKKRNECLAQTVIKGLQSRNMSGYNAANREEALKLADAFFRLQDQLTRGFMAMGAPQIGQCGTSSDGMRMSFCRASISRTAASLS